MEKYRLRMQQSCWIVRAFLSDTSGDARWVETLSSCFVQGWKDCWFVVDFLILTMHPVPVYALQGLFFVAPVQLSDPQPSDGPFLDRWLRKPVDGRHLDAARS